MAVTVPLVWLGASDADTDTDYVITSDETLPGTITDVVATQGATSPFVPVETTLNGTINATVTSVTLTDGTNFANGDVVVIDSEMILLGGKSTHVFASCVRAQLPTIAASHTTGVKVYKAHESLDVTDVTYAAGRHLIRFNVQRVQGADVAAVATILAFNPSVPKSSQHCVLFGCIEDLQGNAKNGITVTALIAGGDNYSSASGVLLIAEDETDTTDSDGYWELQMVKDAYRVGGDIITLTIGDEAFTDISIPDQDYVYFFNA